ncbi:MAG: response regulator transcription factor [Ignavibacteria bacterium]|nr:response regulator transcription factor [Ignavibacteria bacterium]
MIDETILPKEITVLVADDHEIVRAGLRKVLSIDKRIRIVGEAVDGKEAVSFVRDYKPMIVLMDISMPNMDGIKATTIIKSEFPDTQVLILTAFEDIGYIERALSAQADGYLSKEVSPSFLIDAIYRVLIGERVFSKSILNILNRSSNLDYTADNTNVLITKREHEILNYIALGKTSKEIGEILGISVRTVQNHRSNIMQKLGIKTASGLVRFSILYTSQKK